MTIEELNSNQEISLKGEIWKEIKGWENYAISNYGRVFALKKKMFKQFTTWGKITKRGIRPRRYLSVHLYHKEKENLKLVHRLVAEAFVHNDDPEHKTLVDHIDNDPKNNMAVNLRWVCPSVNNELARNDELQKYNRWLLQKIKG